MIKNLTCKALIALAAMISTEAAAQISTTGPQSSSSIVRRADSERRGRGDKADAMSSRMQNFYGSDEESDADGANVQWMRVIYRSLDLQKDANAVLYYPEDADAGQENLFRVIMGLLASNTVPAYEYLDGREVFADNYRVNVKDMLDRFHILYTDAKGSTERNPKFEIDPADVPTNEVLSYYIIEKWEFDNRENRMTTKVEAICPVLHRTGDFGGEAVRYPMFWVKMQDVKPYLTKQQVFVSDDNNLPTCNLADYFTMNLYDGDIYKTRNLRNRSLAQIHTTPEALQNARDSIDRRLNSFDDNIWVPSREELMAANGDSTALESDNKPSRNSSARNRRASSSSPKPSKVKESKPKTSSSSAERSVRRRRR